MTITVKHNPALGNAYGVMSSEQVAAFEQQVAALTDFSIGSVGTLGGVCENTDLGALDRAAKARNDKRSQRRPRRALTRREVQALFVQRQAAARRAAFLAELDA